MIEVNTQNITKKTLREFGLLMGVMFPLFFYLIIPWLFSVQGKEWSLYLGGAFFGFGLAAPKLLKPIYIGWMKIGGFLGHVNTRIILGVVYYIMITPMAFMFRVLGKDPLNRKIDSNLKTYKIIRDNSFSTESMERPF